MCYFFGSIGPGPCAWPCASLMSLRRSSRAFVSSASVSGMRTRGSRAIVSLPPAIVTNGPPASGAGFGEGHFRQFARLAGQRKILAQRKIRIAFPHQNPAQIGMPAKANAHHVVNLALMPIGRAPDVGDGRQLGFLLAHIGLEPQMAVMAVTVKVINHRQARIVAVIIDAR